MRIVIGVDSSEEASAAVDQVTQFARSFDEVILVHGMDLGLFQPPAVAEAMNLQGYEDFRYAMLEAGRQVVEVVKDSLQESTEEIEGLVCGNGQQ